MHDPDSPALRATSATSATSAASATGATSAWVLRDADQESRSTVLRASGSGRVTGPAPGAGPATQPPNCTSPRLGAACCRVRVGIEQWPKEVDRRVTKLDPRFHDMVAFESTAREIYARFRKGGCFVANGYVQEFEVDGRKGKCPQGGEFVARKIGHSVTVTDHVVQRGRHAADRPLTAEPQPPAVGRTRHESVPGRARRP